MPEDDAQSLVPVVVSGQRHDVVPRGPALVSIDIDIGGVKVSVPPGFDPDHLGRVIAAVRDAS
jgi:transposase